MYICFSQVAQNCRKLVAICDCGCSSRMEGWIHFLFVEVVVGLDFSLRCRSMGSVAIPSRKHWGGGEAGMEAGGGGDDEPRSV